MAAAAGPIRDPLPAHRSVQLCRIDGDLDPSVTEGAFRRATELRGALHASSHHAPHRLRTVLPAAITIALLLVEGTTRQKASGGPSGRLPGARVEIRLRPLASGRPSSVGRPRRSARDRIEPRRATPEIRGADGLVFCHLVCSPRPRPPEGSRTRLRRIHRSTLGQLDPARERPLLPAPRRHADPTSIPTAVAHASNSRHCGVMLATGSEARLHDLVSLHGDGRRGRGRGFLPRSLHPPPPWGRQKAPSRTGDRRPRTASRNGSRRSRSATDPCTCAPLRTSVNEPGTGSDGGRTFSGDGIRW